MKSIRRWIVPISLMALALGLINLGLYGWFGPGEGSIPRHLPFMAQFDDPSALEQWQAFGGKWELAGGKLFQIAQTPDYSVIYTPLRLDAEQAYQVQTVLHVEPETTAGILFNVLYPRFHRQSQFVFVHAENGNTSASAGYFVNAQPEVQVEQTISPTPTVELTVIVGPDGYTAYANGQLIARDIPLYYRGGGIGLVTRGSGLAFDNLTIEPDPLAGTVQPASTVLDVTDLVASSGDLSTPAPGPIGPLAILGGSWVQNSVQITQESTDPLFFAASSASLSADYSVSAAISSSNGALVGGGFLVNMQDSQSLYGANVVRFSGGGKRIIWGYFSNSEFISQGQHDLASDQASPLPILRVDVADATYSISVNNVSIATGIPLLNRIGWLGLVTFGGPIGFNNIHLSIGGLTECRNAAYCIQYRLSGNGITGSFFQPWCSFSHELWYWVGDTLP